MRSDVPYYKNGKRIAYILLLISTAYFSFNLYLAPISITEIFLVDESCF